MGAARLNNLHVIEIGLKSRLIKIVAELTVTPSL